MPPQLTLNEKVDQYKKDLDTIQEMLDQIKREYDLYFVGVRKRQPFEMRSQIERLLRKWRSSTIQKTELAFRLTTLNSKYNAMIDVWDKIIKRRELDPHALSPFGPSTAQLAAEMTALNAAKSGATPGAEAKAAAPAAAAPAGQAAAAAQARAAAPVDRETQMRRLFDQYVDAKKDLGETIETLSFAKFKGQLDKQTDQLRDKMQCKDVEFSVIRKGGKVSLTAKPVKE